MKVNGPHWSASQFMLFEQCPAEYKKRYVDGEALELTEALCFGKAIHQGLEAHYNNEDGEWLFRAVWKSEAARLNGHVHRDLTGMGLTLLEKVFALDLKGQAEREFTLNTEPALGKPVVGAVDLWGSDHVLYDFKTTRGQWSDARAQTEVWQPMLYSWAALEQDGTIPQFEYIVLNRVTGQLDRFRRQWDEDSWGAQWTTMYERMRAISARVACGQMDCHGNHGYCPECGVRWAHEHVCDEPTSKRIRVSNA